MKTGAADQRVGQSANPALNRPGTAWEPWAARLAGRATTTPGRMRLAGVAIAVSLLAVALVGTGALRSRQRAASAIGTQAEPLLVGAETIYSSLADADATATNSFLRGGLEAADRRQVYLDDLATATDQLAKVAAQAGTSTDAAHALGVINKDLPTYTGLIEAARANNRLGFPVGAAYLREGSTLMQNEILPATGQLYQVEAGRLNRAYHSGQSLLDIAGVLALGGLALAVLVLAQGLLARRTNRILNPGLVAASILVVLLMAWATVAFVVSGTQLRQAQRKGSDSVQLLSSGRILVTRAQVDENLALVARGSGSQYLADFEAVKGVLGPPTGQSGLLVEAASTVSPGAGSSLLGPDNAWTRYLATHDAVVAAETGGHFDMAVALATNAGDGGELTAATAVSHALTGGIQQAQTVFDAKAAAGSNDLSGLGLGVIALALLAVVAALIGLERRIVEYR